MCGDIHFGSEPGRTVGAVAELLGLTVRALHHWDDIGLVRPSARSAAGYRLYTAADLTRLERVLVYRKLDLPLEEIGRLLDTPATAAESLREQRERIRARTARLERTAQSLDRLLEARESGILLSAEQQIRLFGEQWQPSWAGEARARWGDTAQWAQYAERAANRDAADWQRIAEDVRALEVDLAAARRAGVLPGSAAADALAERHRASIGVYFDCTVEMHVCLGRRYVEDTQMCAYYDGIEPGLAGWLRAVIEANARARGVDPATATWE
ncbi:MerR family transcriptional regulator [Nocardia jinanensis]|uniref:MerR family transcriptional regulator n=1 Tax=Nocardia jinanensis TaxID=382504 RepID=A0A917RGX4_9NOCA|nr:MerR family transcriptional regulator [Nocardia jinanensis]GGL06525.1 MerR family transcriptional regulator [Nocardia jinanensis]